MADTHPRLPIPKSAYYLVSRTKHKLQKYENNTQLLTTSIHQPTHLLPIYHLFNSEYIDTANRNRQTQRTSGRTTTRQRSYINF